MRAGTVVREPGGTPVGEAIRDMLLHGPHAPDPWTETLLYAAARAELVARILLPELSRGRVLVLDRFVDSSLAYQGCARGLGLDEVLAVNRPGLRGVLPDLTLILDMDPAESMRRLGGEHDRMEAEGLGFQQRRQGGLRRRRAALSGACARHRRRARHRHGGARCGRRGARHARATSGWAGA